MYQCTDDHRCSERAGTPRIRRHCHCQHGAHQRQVLCHPPTPLAVRRERERERETFREWSKRRWVRTSSKPSCRAPRAACLLNRRRSVMHAALTAVDRRSSPACPWSATPPTSHRLSRESGERLPPADSSPLVSLVPQSGRRRRGDAPWAQASGCSATSRSRAAATCRCSRFT